MARNTRIARFRNDESGAAAVLTALIMFVVVGAASFAIDVGSFYYEKRRQQTATDLAAIAAASDLPRAHAAAVASLTQNQYTSSHMTSMRLGTYLPDPAVAANKRFTAASSGNAAQVTVESTTPLILGRIFSQILPAAQASDPGANSGRVAIRTTAIAAVDRRAAFAIGSRLLKVEHGILNAMLGELLGANVSLSVMDYEALASAKIDLFSFFTALAARMRLTAVSYDQVVSSDVRLGDAMLAASEAARGSSAGSTAVHALTALANAAAGSAKYVDLDQLVSFGVFGSHAVGSAPISASLTAFDLVSALGQISNGSHQIEADLQVTAPGIISASLKLAIGERPVGTSMVAIGAEGATVHTAQTRLLLTVGLIGPGEAPLIKLPIYIEIATGTARLSSLSCAHEDAKKSVTLGVRPGIVDAWIGSVSESDFNNFRTAPNPGQAVLLQVAQLLSVTGRAHVTMSNTSETPVTFSHQDILQARKKTATTTNFTSSLVSALANNLSLKLHTTGLGLGLGLDNVVAQKINQAAPAIDSILAEVLTSLGVNVGQADTWVSGVRCGAVLVY